jgi:hypothetical protein
MGGGVGVREGQVHQMVIQGGQYAPERLKADEVASMLLAEDGIGWLAGFV